MKRRIMTMLLCACLLAVPLAYGEGLLPTLSNAYGVAMPSLTEALLRYPESEVTVDGAAVERWVSINEDDFNTFGVYLKKSGATLQTYQVEGSVFTATVTKAGGSFVFVFNTETETADVTYPAGSYDERLFAVKSVWNAAEEAETAGRYSEAAEKYASLICYEDAAECYRDSDQRELRCYYTEGEAKRTAQDWDGARTAFTNAGEYSDAATQISATYYAEGEAKRAAQDWDGAVTAFTQAGNYSDAAIQIKETNYQHAATLLENGDAAGALIIFNTLTGYKDVDSLLKNDDSLAAAAAAAAAREAKLKPFKTIGGYVFFGMYPQTGAGDDQTPIEWLVLDYDAANNKALLISRYGLDAKPYNTEKVDITWEKCTLRAWLNNDFLNAAFSADEQKAILLTNVDNSKSQGYSGWSTSGGNNTQDKVFLLSYAEANNYLGVEYYKVTGAESNTKSRVAPTAYALKQGARTNSSNKTADGTAAGRWWLRSPGFNQRCAANADSVGALYFIIVYNGNGCVRPALWIDLESGIF